MERVSAVFLTHQYLSATTRRPNFGSSEQRLSCTQPYNSGRLVRLAYPVRVLSLRPALSVLTKVVTVVNTIRCSDWPYRRTSVRQTNVVCRIVAILQCSCSAHWREVFIWTRWYPGQHSVSALLHFWNVQPRWAQTRNKENATNKGNRPYPRTTYYIKIPRL